MGVYYSYEDGYYIATKVTKGKMEIVEKGKNVVKFKRGVKYQLLSPHHNITFEWRGEYEKIKEHVTDRYVCHILEDERKLYSNNLLGISPRCLKIGATLVKIIK